MQTPVMVQNMINDAKDFGRNLGAIWNFIFGFLWHSLVLVAVVATAFGFWILLSWIGPFMTGLLPSFSETQNAIPGGVYRGFLVGILCGWLSAMIRALWLIIREAFLTKKRRPT